MLHTLLNIKHIPINIKYIKFYGIGGIDAGANVAWFSTTSSSPGRTAKYSVASASPPVAPTAATAGAAGPN
jgi:hypothetical protein